MSYTKFHDPWGSGSCCGTPDPGPDTPIVKAALNQWEQGLFDAHNMEAATAGTFQQTSKVVGDADVRYRQDADGKLQWGSGTGPLDTQLYRDAASILKTDGAFKALIHLSEQTSASDISFASKVTGDATWRWEEHADGHMYWSDGTNPPDVELSRSAAGVLQTNADFSINQTGTGNNTELFLSADNNRLDSIYFRTGTLNRWALNKNLTLESGANSGSDFTIGRYDDAGTFVGTSLTITRSTGVVAVQSPGVANGAVVTVDGTQPLTNKTISGTGAVATTSLLAHKVTGDTQLRWNVDASGKQSWSPGSGSFDTTLERGAAGQLLTNADVHSVRVSTAVAFSGMVTADTNNRWQVTVNGSMSWGAGSGAVDCNIARTSVGVLRATNTAIQVSQTNASFGAFQTLVLGADTTARWGVAAGGAHQWSSGSAAFDIQLTRPSANVLAVSPVSAGVAAFVVAGSAAGQASSITLASTTAATGSRWQFAKDNTAESGANAGSNFFLQALSDTGTFVGNAISIVRSSMATTLGGSVQIVGNVGFYNTAPVAKPTVTGSRGGNAALASLLTALASQGLLTDSSTA